MSKMFWTLLIGLALTGAVRAGGIVEVLENSQLQRLQQRGQAAPDTERAARVRASFDRLVALAPPPQPVELRVIPGAIDAEAMLGRLLVVTDAVGDLPEGERLLLLAHELAHLRFGHWQALCGLYLEHIPGEVKPETTDPVAGVLGEAARQLSHKHEYEADAWGYALVKQLGFGIDNAFGLLTRRGVAFDTVTHPATRRRLAQLRMLDTQLAHPHLAEPVQTEARARQP